MYKERQLDIDTQRRQLQTGKGVGADSYNGMFDCFSKIVKNEGYVLSSQPAFQRLPDSS